MADIPAFRSPLFDFQFALGRVILAPRARLAISAVPKIASSSLKTAIMESEYPAQAASHISSDDLIDRVHQYDGLLILKNFADLAGAQTMRVLRDPVRRVVSAYQNKFLQDIEVKITAGACNFLRKPASEISFEDFLHYLANAANFWLDPHFRPQSDFFLFARYDYNFLLEDPGPLADFVQRRLGVRLRRANDGSRRHPVSDLGFYCGDRPASYFIARQARGEAGPEWRNFLNPTVSEAIRRRFRDDVDLYEGIRKSQEESSFF